MIMHDLKASLVPPTRFICVPGDPWQHPIAALALCDDGKVRRVRLNRQADGFFSWSGRVSYRGSTVRCYIYSDEGVLRVCLLGKIAVSPEKAIGPITDDMLLEVKPASPEIEARWEASALESATIDHDVLMDELGGLL